jgi:hypothetical protein
VAAHLGALSGRVWLPEVTFVHFGERGVIDILAWHAASRSLLIIELSTELVDPQALVAVMHRRVRLGPMFARQHSWRPATVSASVIGRDTSTERRRVARHAHLLRTAFPAEGRTMRGWLSHPRGTISGLSFWSDNTPQGRSEVRGRVERVRRASAALSRAQLKRGAALGRASGRPVDRGAAG